MKFPRFLLPLLSILSIFSCKSYTKIPVPEPSLKDRVMVSRSADGDYTFKFTNEGSYKVYVGDSPTTIDWSKPLFETEDSEVNISNLEKNKRFYFGVKTADDLEFVVSERRIPVYSIPNFRDVGGIPTEDGKVTKWGELYRSGDLAELSKKDMDYFSSLNIKTVVDFRNAKEIKKDPNKYPKDSKINYVKVIIGDEDGNLQEALRKQVLKNRSNPDFDSKAFVEKVNRDFIDDYAQQYIPLMSLLMNEKNYPLLFHCTAGKDRTGLATALIFSAIGVDKDYIMEDYLMSNYYRNQHNNEVLKKMTTLGVSQSVAQPLLEVNRDYLEAAFDQMKINYGDTNTFLEKDLGIGEKEKNILRSHLLTTGDSEVLPASAKNSNQ